MPKKFLRDYLQEPTLEWSTWKQLQSGSLATMTSSKLKQLFDFVRNLSS